MFVGDAHIMKFCRHPENVILTYDIEFITTKFFKYSFSVPPGSENNHIYQISHKLWREVPRTSELHPKVTSA